MTHKDASPRLHPLRSRAVKFSDLPTLAKLEQRAQSESGPPGPWPIEHIEVAITRALDIDSHDVFRVATAPKRNGSAPVVGFLYYRIIGQVLELRRLLVDPRCRRQGVALFLLRHAEKVAKLRPTPKPERGYRTIQAQVAPGNLELQRFFRRVGLVCSRPTGDQPYLFESEPLEYLPSTFPETSQ